MKYMGLAIAILCGISFLITGCSNGNEGEKTNFVEKSASVEKKRSPVEERLAPVQGNPGRTVVEPSSATDRLAHVEARIPWMGQSIWALGVNYAWSNPSGFGYDFSDANWKENWGKIQTDIDMMQSRGVTTLRWWVFAGLDQAPLWSGTDRGSTVTGLPDNWTSHMVAAADYAHSRGIKIYWCLTSFDLALSYNSQTHDDIIDNAKVQASYLEYAVKPIVNALKSNPGVMGWDMINEPEWIIRAEDGGDPKSDARRVFSLQQVRSFVANNVSTIHSLGAVQPVSVGSASAKWNGKQFTFWTGLGLDFYDIHWYDWYTPYFDPSVTEASVLGLDKPVLIGEVMSDPSNQYSGATSPRNHLALAEGVFKHGYAGYMPWAWTDSNHNTSGTIAPHFQKIAEQHPEIAQIFKLETTNVR
jgi:hypothetical protein